jgi:hypothetical protein
MRKLPGVSKKNKQLSSQARLVTVDSDDFVTLNIPYGHFLALPAGNLTHSQALAVSHPKRKDRYDTNDIYTFRHSHNCFM